MGRTWFAFAAYVAASFAPAARAEEPVPEPPAPPAAEAPALAPSPEETRRVIEMAPPASAAPAPTFAPAAPPAPAPCCPPTACFQKRDECGWPVDDCGNRRGCWELFVAGSASWYSSPDGRLGELVQGITSPLEWNDVDYPIGFGGRAAIRRRVAPQSRLELAGAYYGSVDDQDTQSGNFGAFPGQTGTGDLSRPVIANFDSEAEAWDVEFNWWTEVSCVNRMRVEVGAGLRYLSFLETSRVDFTTTGPGPFPVDDGFVESEADNAFFGGQIGVAAYWDLSQCFTLGASMKMMFGQINRDVAVRDLDIFAGNFHSSNSEDDEFVFGLDLELGVQWQVSRCLALNAGVEVLILDNVQRAEDAMDFSHSNTGAVQAIQNPDQLIIDSVFVGFTLTL